MDTLRTRWNIDQLNKARNAWSFFCPQCKAPRRVPYRPRPTAQHYVQVGLTAAVFMLVSWSWFQWKGIVSFVPIWAVFEFVYRARFRAALNCEYCRFDPYLYLVDVKRARREIEDHWRKKFEERGIPFPSDTPASRPAAHSLGAAPLDTPASRPAAHSLGAAPLDTPASRPAAHSLGAALPPADENSPDPIARP